MQEVKPEVNLVSIQLIDWDGLEDYFESVGTESFELSALNDHHDLVETAGRLCYRSWEPGMNRNVTRVRADQEAYIENILKSGHGSVLEHINYGFIFRNVSRVFTHELIRHRAGSAFSQESLRYVRLDELKFWFPDWVPNDLKEQLTAVVEDLEKIQRELADRFDLDNPETSFHAKKQYSSFMRRFAPEGLGTDIMWTANARTMRHVIESRTAPGAEEEMRLVFSQVAKLVKNESPYLFQDFEETDGSWVPKHHKV